MYVHHPAPPIAEPTVRPWGSQGSMCVDLGTAVIILQSPEDADALIKAAVEAKRLLATAGAFTPGDFPPLPGEATASVTS